MWSCFQPRSSQEEQLGGAPFFGGPVGLIGGKNAGILSLLASVLYLASGGRGGSGPLPTKVLCTPCVWPQHTVPSAGLPSWVVGFRGQGAGWGRGIIASSVQLGSLCAGSSNGLACALRAGWVSPRTAERSPVPSAVSDTARLASLKYVGIEREMEIP